MISVYLIHEFIRDLDGMIKYLHASKEIQNNLVWDCESPDILIASEWIYYKRRLFNDFKKLWPKAKLKIMYAGEAIEPDFNLFDYVIGFSNQCCFGDRFIRIMSPLDMFPGFIHTKVNSIRNIEEASKCLMSKTKFCNFLYSNPIAHPRRDQLFYEISTYKQVDSLGRHLNNVGKMGTGFVGHASECKDIKSLYKFSIACENATFDGYTSEKVFTSFTAHTIPIYWGNKYISEDVNPLAIINANDFSSHDDLIDYIKYIDTHDDVWMQMIMEPWMTEKQMQHHKSRTQKYLDFINWLFTGEVNNKKRLAEGTHVENYRFHFFNGEYSMQLNKYNVHQYVDKALKKILNTIHSK